MLTEKTYTFKNCEYVRGLSNVFYKKDGYNIRKEYVIEYCDDACKLNRLGLLPEYGGLELDDVYHKITFKEDENERFYTFDGVAIEWYLAYLFDSKIVDVKMWENIYDGEELIEERFFEFPATFCHSTARRIARDITDAYDREKQVNEELVKENEKMKAFLKKYHAYERYREESENV